MNDTELVREMASAPEMAEDEIVAYATAAASGPQAPDDLVVALTDRCLYVRPRQAAIDPDEELGPHRTIPLETIDRVSVEEPARDRVRVDDWQEKTVLYGVDGVELAEAIVDAAGLSHRRTVDPDRFGNRVVEASASSVGMAASVAIGLLGVASLVAGLVLTVIVVTAFIGLPLIAVGVLLLGAASLIGTGSIEIGAKAFRDEATWIEWSR